MRMTSGKMSEEESKTERQVCVSRQVGRLTLLQELCSSPAVGAGHPPCELRTLLV